MDEAIAYYNEGDIKGEFVVLVEGKPAEIVEVTGSIEELMERYMDEGMTEKDAMKQVAKDKGISKSEVYATLKKK